MHAVIRAMDEAALLLRIRVIVVSARAAVRSLGPGHPKVPGVVARGAWLLDEIAPIVVGSGHDGVRRAYDEARSELVSMDPEGEEGVVT
jgi:hypothetical protein